MNDFYAAGLIKGFIILGSIFFLILGFSYFSLPQLPPRLIGAFGVQVDLGFSLAAAAAQISVESSRYTNGLVVKHVINKSLNKLLHAFDFANVRSNLCILCSCEVKTRSNTE